MRTFSPALRGGTLALLLVGTAVGNTAAQQPLVGVVVDPSRRPIVGADVLVGNRKTTTGENGGFRIDSLKPGTYPMTVRAVGFWPQRTRITFEARPRELQIVLRPSPVLLPEIAVEGRRNGIYGTVGDATSGGRSGAKVEIIGHGGGERFSDSTGAFSFPDADRGDYLIVVSLAGYEQRRLSLRIDDGKGRELAIHMYPGRDGGPGRMETWAFEDLRKRLASWPRRSRMTSTDIHKFQGVDSICDIARVQSAVGTGANVVLNGIMTLQNWPVCDFKADEIELIEFAAEAQTGYRRGAMPARRGTIYIWERR